MPRFPFVRPHDRWRSRLGAYLDGELNARDRALMAQHLAGCGSCASSEQALSDLKLRIAAIPEVEPPRSFRLTPAMVESPPVRSSAPRAAQVRLRFAQMTAAVAIMALGIVVVVDLRGNAGTGTRSGAPLSASEKSAGGFGAATDDAFAPTSAVPAATIPPFRSGDVGPQSVSTPSEASRVVTPIPNLAPAADGSGSATPGEETLELPDHQEASDEHTAYRWGEAGLAAVAVAAVGAWLFIRRSKRSDSRV